MIMQIQTMQWYPYRIPLPASFTTAHEVLATREGIIVELSSTDGVIGIGECAPLPGFSGGTLADVRASLQTIQLAGLTVAQALAQLQQATSHLPTATICGLETALLDILGHTQSCSIAALLGTIPLSTRQQVPVNTVIGAQSLTLAIKQAQRAIEQGFTSIKLKVGHDTRQTIELVEAVRATLGPACHLRLDANEAWNVEQARTILTACRNLAIQYVEQPLNRDDLAGMAALRRMVSIPIAADEVLSDLESARRVLAAEAADVFIVKPQLAGGLRAGRQMIREATAHGIQCVVTSTIEAGIGVVSALQLAAASPEVQLACGLATLQLLADDLMEEALPVRQGQLSVPTGPGLGIHVDRVALAKYRLKEQKPFESERNREFK